MIIHIPSRHLIGALLTAVSGLVLAQAEPVATVAVLAQPQEPTLASTEKSTTPVQLEAVVVTGELIRREARRTTSSVAAQTGKQIERSTAIDAYDVLRATPNVGTHDDSNAYGGITIRGIPSYGANTQGGAYIYSSATSIVLDGVGLPRAAQAYGDLSAFDLDRIEIFRGPQSTSQGRNAMAGAVVITSAAPRLDAVGGLESVASRGRFTGSERAGYQAALALDYTPLADVLGLRLGNEHRGTVGEVRNITRNEDDWARESSHSTKLRTTLKPGGADGRYQVTLSLRDLSRFTGSRYTEQANERQREATNNEPTDTRTQAQLFALEQSYALSERWALRAVSALARSQTFTRLDLDYSADDAGTFLLDQPARGLSQELRARYEGERLRATVGAYYFKSRDDDVGTSQINVNAVLRFAGLCVAPQLCSAPIGNVLSDFAIPTRISNTALFGEADWQVFDSLTLTAGLRLDRERNQRTYVSNTSGDTPAALTAVTVLQTVGALGPNGSDAVKRSFGTVLPKLAAVYEVTEGWFTGASYVEGYRPGGGGYNPTSQRRFEFDSERTKNYELSLKGGWQPWRLDGTLHVFRTDWSDMQVENGSGFDVFVDNAGRARIDGGELELRFKPLKPLQLIGGLGISRGRFVDYQSSRGDFTGNPLPRAPKRSASLALEWQATRTLLIRPDVLHVGGTPAQPDNGPTHQTPAYTLFNLALRWQQGPFALFANAQNLADRFYRTDAATYGLSSKAVSVAGAGRRLTAGVDFQFQ